MKKFISNQALALLTKLSHQARQHIGPVKVNAMANDDQYLLRVLIESVSADDAELVTLAEQVSKVMAFEAHLLQAFIAYWRDYKKRNVNDQSTQNSKTMLLGLAEKLYGLAIDGAAYRQAVNHLLVDLGPNEKRLCVDIARAFYPYWIKTSDKPLEPEDNASVFNDLHKTSLMDLWQALQGKILTSADDEKINHYIDVMRKVKLADREIDVRRKIATLILIEQQQYGESSDSYRQNIKKIVSLIANTRLQDYVLEVAREFHHFCLKA